MAHRYSTFRCSAFNIQYGHWSGQARGWYLKMLIVGKNGNSLVGRRLSTRDFHTLRMQKYQSIRVIIIIGRVRCIAFEWWCGMLAIRLYVRPYVRLLNALIRFDLFFFTRHSSSLVPLRLNCKFIWCFWLWLCICVCVSLSLSLCAVRGSKFDKCGRWGCSTCSYSFRRLRIPVENEENQRWMKCW